MKQRAAAMLVALVVLMSVGGPGAAHRITSFDACVGNRHRTVLCRDRYLALAGDGVWLHAHARPNHTGRSVSVWRRDSQGVWRKVAHRPSLDDRGWVRWRWQTEAHHAKDVAYRLRVVLPGHGTSDTVRLLVIEPDH